MHGNVTGALENGDKVLTVNVFLERLLLLDFIQDAVEQREAGTKTETHSSVSTGTGNM